jgi:hypothetical protein
MKLSNLLLAAALFFSAGIAFAKNGDEESSVTTSSYSDFADMTTDENSGMVNILAFEFNGSGNWKYYLYAIPSEEGAAPYQFELDASTASSSPYGEVLASQVNQVKDALDSLDLSAEDRAAVDKAHKIYKFSIPFDGDAISALGLSGSNPGDHTAFVTIDDLQTIYSAPANNGMGFSEGDVSDQQALVFGKWNKFNNGALFLVSVTAPTSTVTQGQPLPAPVTTLLIALAFGGAFVMYRNRKQVKA